MYTFLQSGLFFIIFDLIVAQDRKYEASYGTWTHL